MASVDCEPDMVTPCRKSRPDAKCPAEVPCLCDTTILSMAASPAKSWDIAAHEETLNFFYDDAPVLLQVQNKQFKVWHVPGG